jgi:hypothetical protein
MEIKGGKYDQRGPELARMAASDLACMHGLNCGVCVFSIWSV